MKTLKIFKVKDLNLGTMGAIVLLTLSGCSADKSNSDRNVTSTGHGGHGTYVPGVYTSSNNTPTTKKSFFSGFSLSESHGG